MRFAGYRADVPAPQPNPRTESPASADSCSPARPATASGLHIIGQEGGLAACMEEARSVAPTDATVLLRGETGTGKDLVARAIHGLSPRRDRPFITINCGALPGGVVESELFGHERGGFTGAVTQRPGRFELAHRGTLFLDEIGELPLDLQPKLLRVLQRGELERVGGTRTLSVDVRVIAATNRDLEAAVQAGTFREDLYYRLSVFPLWLPPLRARRTDIPHLVAHFVALYAARFGKRVESIPDRTMRRLLAHPWPGNVRELENAIARAIILTRRPELELPAGAATPGRTRRRTGPTPPVRPQPPFGRIPARPAPSSSAAPRLNL